MPTPFQLRKAACIVRAGGIIAYPTEAVFGLGCDPVNEQAVRRLRALKQRPEAKGLIVIGADFEQLAPWVLPLSDADYARLAATWPGPVTWLLPARPETPRWLRGAHTTLAVRVTAHPVASALCRAAATALVSTSANRAERPPARTALAVRQRVGAGVDYVDYIVPGAVGGAAQPSEIRDLASGRIVRPG